MEKVSCLTVTNGRLSHFKNSYLSYCQQDYSAKELVVITAGSDEYLDGLRQLTCDRDDVRCISVRGNLALGALRQISLEQASGPLICQWDDDDFNHPARLSTQITAMTKAKARASYFADNLHFFSDTRRLYWCNWRHSPFHPAHPGTLLAYKSDVPNYNVYLNHREDSDVQKKLQSRVRIALLHGVGYLYTYVFHGQNVFSREHHAKLVRDYGFSANEITNVRSILGHALSEYRCDIDPPIIISDNSESEIFKWLGRHMNDRIENLGRHTPTISILEPSAAGIK